MKNFLKIFVGSALGIFFMFPFSVHAASPWTFDLVCSGTSMGITLIGVDNTVTHQTNFFQGRIGTSTPYAKTQAGEQGTNTTATTYVNTNVCNPTYVVPPTPDANKGIDWSQPWFIEAHRPGFGNCGSYVNDFITDSSKTELQVTNECSGWWGYQQFEGGGGPPGAPLTFTHIVSQNSPLQSSITGSETVTFDYDYQEVGNENPLMERAGIQINQIENGFEYNTASIVDVINATGNFTYTHNFPLAAGGAYSWRPYLSNASSTDFIYGNWITFSVVTQNGISSPYTPLPQNVIASSTLSTFCQDNFPFDDTSIITITKTFLPAGICTIIAFITIPPDTALTQYSSLPQQLESAFPFSYVYSISTTWDSLSTTTATSSPTYEIDFASAGIGSTTPMGNILPDLTAFSYETVTHYFPAGTFDLLRTLAGIALILTLFLDIFFTIRNLIRT